MSVPAVAGSVDGVSPVAATDYDGDNIPSEFNLAVDADTRGNGGADDGFTGAEPYFEVHINGQQVTEVRDLEKRQGTFYITLSRDDLSVFDTRQSLDVTVRLLDRDLNADDTMGRFSRQIEYEPVPDSRLAFESVIEYERAYEKFRTERLSKQYYQDEQVQEVTYSIEAMLPLTRQDIATGVLEERVPGGSLASSLFTVVDVGVATGTSLEAGKRAILLDEMDSSDDGDYEQLRQTLQQLEDNTENIADAGSIAEREQYLETRVMLLEQAYRLTNENQNNLRAALSDQRDYQQFNPSLFGIDILSIYEVDEKTYDTLQGETVKLEQTLRSDYVFTQTALQQEGIRSLSTEAGYTAPEYPDPQATISVPDGTVVGEPTTAIITVTNQGGDAVIQTAALSFPDADGSQVSITRVKNSDPNYADVFTAGESLGTYGIRDVERIEASYPLVESAAPLDGGNSFSMEVTFVPREPGTFRIYGKSVGRNGGWFAYPNAGSSGPRDQQNERVVVEKVSVVEPNPSPSVSVEGGTVQEGSSLTLTATATDPENQPLEYEWSTPQAGEIQGEGREVSYLAPNGLTESKTVPVSVTVTTTEEVSFQSPKSVSDDATVRIEDINPRPDVSLSNATVSEGESVVLQAVGANPEEDGLEYEWSFEGPGSFSADDDTLSYRAPNDISSNTNASITVIATEPQGRSASAEASISVSNSAANDDSDGDGIPDREDGEPNKPEDVDGFEDADGIPDEDNDNDGILDEKDAAPNTPEDNDGCQDNDGAPEPAGSCDTETGVVEQYDTNGQAGIQVTELNTGIDDYFVGEISIEQLNTLIDAYFQQL
jgi:hypothetical protein